MVLRGPGWEHVLASAPGRPSLGLSDRNTETHPLGPALPPRDTADSGPSVEPICPVRVCPAHSVPLNTKHGTLPR